METLTKLGPVAVIALGLAILGVVMFTYYRLKYGAPTRKGGIVGAAVAVLASLALIVMLLLPIGAGRVDAQGGDPPCDLSDLIERLPDGIRDTIDEDEVESYSSQKCEDIEREWRDLIDTPPADEDEEEAPPADEDEADEAASSSGVCPPATHVNPTGEESGELTIPADHVAFFDAREGEDRIVAIFDDSGTYNPQAGVVWSDGWVYESGCDEDEIRAQAETHATNLSDDMGLEGDARYHVVESEDFFDLAA